MAIIMGGGRVILFGSLVALASGALCPGLAPARGGLGLRSLRLAAGRSIERGACRSRVQLTDADANLDLKAEVEKLRDETKELRAELKLLEEVNELAKPPKPVKPPPPPPPRAPPPAPTSKLDLPFGIRIEAGMQQTDDGKPPRRGGSSEEPLLQFDLESSRLQPFGRFVSILPYLVPLLDGAVFAPAQDPWIPLLQAAQLYYNIPFGTLAFFILFSTLSRNYDLPYALRFNMRQAIMLDIAISIPSLIGALIGAITGSQAVLGFEQEVQTLVFYVAFGTVLYCQLCNLVGVLPKGIPFISESAEQNSGPR